MVQSRLTDDLRHVMELRGFSVDQNLDLGIATAAFHANMTKRWWLLPYSLQYYAFQPDMAPCADLECMRELLQAASLHTNTSIARVPRWFRWTVPITIALLFSSNGFAEELTLHVHNKKQRCKVGDVGCVILVDTGSAQVHRLHKAGLNGWLPLSYASRYTLDLLKQAGYC